MEDFFAEMLRGVEGTSFNPFNKEVLARPEKLLTLPIEENIQAEVRNVRFTAHQDIPPVVPPDGKPGPYVGEVPEASKNLRDGFLHNRWVFGYSPMELFANSPQETHPWNVASEAELPKEFGATLQDDLKVEVTGTEEDKEWAKEEGWVRDVRMHSRWGLREYVVLEVESSHFDGSWHIGWEGEDGKVQVSRLAIEDTQVRMLSGADGTKTKFFAVSSDGRQIPLEAVGNGNLNTPNEEFDSIRLL